MLRGQIMYLINFIHIVKEGKLNTSFDNKTAITIKLAIHN